MSYNYTLTLADGTVIGFDNYFEDDDPGSGWIDYYRSQTAEVISGPPRPDVYIYDFQWLGREPEQEDENGYDYIFTKWLTVQNQDFLGFDNLNYLTVFNVDSVTEYDYFDIEDIVYHYNGLNLVFVANGATEGVTVVLDDTAASGAALFALEGDKAGVIWVDQVSADELKLGFATIGDTGGISRRSERIETGQVETAPALTGVNIGAAAQSPDGTTVVALEIDGGVFLGRFSARFDLMGPLKAVDGTADGDLVGLVALPGGGFVIGTVVHAPSGTAATLYVTTYDEDFNPAGAPLAFAIAQWGTASLTDLGDGTVQLSWSDGAISHGQVVGQAGEVEHGTAGPETLTGTSWADGLWGAGGNDTLYGRGGSDHLQGEAGNDILVGGLGADVLDGGEGNDIVRYDHRVSLNLKAPAENTGDAKGDSFVSVEQIRGSAENDRLTGDDGGNVFQGRGGDDVLSGGSGDDLLVGNEGADRLRGGAGADQFRFEKPTDGKDVVADFTTGLDKIGIRANGFGIDAIALVSGGAPAPSGSGPVFLFSTASGILAFDADGTGAGAAVEIAELSGVSALSVTDFLLIA